MSILLTPPPYGSSEWLLSRREGLGASEVATIVGVNPYGGGEYELALRKRGLVEDEEESWAMRMGHLMEPIALDWYEEVCRPLVRGETWSDPRWPHLWATLDARVMDDRIGVEAKWSSRDVTTVPQHWYVQVQAQMAIADLDAVDIVLITPRKGPHLLATVERSADAEAECDLAEAWYVRHIVEGIDPPADGSRAANRYLDTLRGEEPATATEEQTILMRALRTVRRQAEELEREDKRIIGALKASMAGIGSLTGPGFRVVWSAVKPRQTTDWRAVARVMQTMGGIAPEVFDAEAERHTTLGEGTTRFAPQWDEEEEKP